MDVWYLSVYMCTCLLKVTSLTTHSINEVGPLVRKWTANWTLNPMGTYVHVFIIYLIPWRLYRVLLRFSLYIYISFFFFFVSCLAFHLFYAIFYILFTSLVMLRCTRTRGKEKNNINFTWINHVSSYGIYTYNIHVVYFISIRCYIKCLRRILN